MLRSPITDSFALHDMRGSPAAQSLSVTEARLEKALRAGNVGVWQLDFQTRQLEASTTFKEHCGCKGDQAFGYAAFQGAVHAVDRERVKAALAKSMHTGADFELECKILRTDGSFGWVELRARVLPSSGHALTLIGVSLDTTQRRAADEQSRHAAVLLRAVMETAPGLIYAKDVQGRMLMANPPALALIGKSWEQVAGRTDAEFLDDPEQGLVIMENDRRVLASGHPDVLEERVGLGETWLSTKAPLRDDAGTIIGLVGISQSITDRKKAEQRLKELNETLELRVAERTRERDRAWNNSQDLLVILDTAGNFAAVNPAWTAVLGWTREELVGQHYLSFICADDHPSSREALAHASSQVLLHYENRYRHKDGSFRWIEWIATPECEFIYASGRHITAEKHATAALACSEEQLRQAQKMDAIGQLTGGIAHDFNNLLLGITGSLEILQRRVAAGRWDGSERYVLAAMTSAQRAAALTQRLLAFARRQPLDPKIVDPNEMIVGMKELLRGSLGPSIELDLVLHAGLWLALCDPNQLESGILNLAINSRDAMPGGGRLTIETANKALDEEYARRQGGEVKAGEYVSISVTDTGGGMTAEVISKAFEPFFTTKPLGRGTGLGLSMVYGFVRQSEGHIRAYSEVGRGTTFTLYLPRCEGKKADQAEENQISAGVAATHDKKVVLVVDDEDMVRMLVTDTLGELGYDTLEAAEGQSALTTLKSNRRVDLLVTDVGLPGLNGRQIAEAARVLRPGLKVLFITGYSHNAALGSSDALDDGMRLLTKPFSLESLAQTVREMVTEQ